jgi:hypothetical protein
MCKPVALDARAYCDGDYMREVGPGVNARRVLPLFAGLGHAVAALSGPLWTGVGQCHQLVIGRR